jgi:cobalt-zinc-cadmium efflux system membrane fusion protein
MSASAVVSTEDTSEGLLVPTAAIRRVGDTDFVFVETNGVVERREVSVRDRFGPRAIVSSGVAVGDRVAITAVSRLRDGDAVQATMIGTSEAAL